MASKLTAAIACFVLLFFVSCSLAQQSPRRPVCFNDRCFQAEVMSTPVQREQGLMFRESLAENSAMLFIFEGVGQLGFWMKNMKFPIDILWIDDNKKVVYIESNVPPCDKEHCQVYAPGVEARYVLEISSGSAEKAGIRAGAILKF